MTITVWVILMLIIDAASRRDALAELSQLLANVRCAFLHTIPYSFMRIIQPHLHGGIENTGSRRKI